MVYDLIASVLIMRGDSWAARLKTKWGIKSREERRKRSKTWKIQSDCDGRPKQCIYSARENMHQIQAGTVCIQTNILYNAVGRIFFFLQLEFFLYYGLGCEKNPLASMSQLTGCVGSLWDGWKLWGHSLREPHAAQEGLFHFAFPAGSNKTAAP